VQNVVTTLGGVVVEVKDCGCFPSNCLVVTRDTVKPKQSDYKHCNTDSLTRDGVNPSPTSINPKIRL